MKNTFAVKTSLFTLILALIAIGTFAFTVVMKKEDNKPANTPFLNQTWYFTGGSSDDPTDPSLYSTNPPSDGCPTPLEKICEVQAPDNGQEQPDMEAQAGSQTVRSQIIEAHASLNDPAGPSLNQTVTAFRAN